MTKPKELDWTFSVDPRLKGTYHRKLGDIRLATGKFSTAKLPDGSAARFLGYYFGCEKLAKGILGIARLRSADIAFDHKTPLDMDQLKAAVKEVGVRISDDDLAKIFGTQLARAKPAQGREIRNRLIHDFGPSNVDCAGAASKTLEPVMKRFLGCERTIQEYLVRLNQQHTVAQKPLAAARQPVASPTPRYQTAQASSAPF